MSESNTDFDWDNVSEAPPKPLEPGLYRAKVVKAEARVSQANNHCVNLELSITGHFQGDELDTPKTSYKNLAFTQKAAGIVKSAARAAGQLDKLPRKATDETMAAFADAMLGSDLVVRTRNGVHPKDKNRTIIEIDRFFTVEQAEVAKAGGDPDAKPDAKGESAPVAEVGGGRRSRRNAA